MTQNHSYNEPDAGTTDWHIPLNENFAKIDADVEIRDTDDARSNYEPKSQAKFLATDTGDVYIGDGSTWNHLGNLSSDTSSFSQVDANQFYHRPDQTVETDNVIPRQLVSTEDIDLYLSPDGDDTNPGTESEPLATLQEAFDRLPFIVQHAVDIKIQPGTYQARSAVSTGMHWINFVKRPKGAGGFKVRGMGSDPSDTHIKGDFWLAVGLKGGLPKASNGTEIKNLEIDGKVQNYNAEFGLKNCIVNVTSSHSAAAKTGVDGYSGQTRVSNCTFNTVDEAVRATDNHRVAVAYSDATNAGSAYGEQWGGQVWWHGSNTPS